MFLNLTQFLEYFDIDKKISKSDFKKKCIICYVKPYTLEQLFSLQTHIIRSVNDQRYIKQDQIVDSLYDLLVTNRIKYLTQFYNNYLAFDHPDDLRWDGPDLLLNDTINIVRNDASKKIIRNLFHLEVLHQTKLSNTINNDTSFWAALTNAFNYFELESRLFAKSSLDWIIKQPFQIFGFMQSYLPKASILNPYTIKWLLTDSKLCKGKRVFTPVLSWASYQLACIYVPQCEHYVGVDVQTTVCRKNRELSRLLNKNLKVSIHCGPSELLLHNNSFMKKYENYFDSVIFCPPYFDMEIYYEGMQSVNTFPKYKHWLKGYFEATVKLVKHVLQPGGTLMLIINDYKSLDGKEYKLIEDCDMIAKSYLEPYKRFNLQNRRSPLRSTKKQRTEQLLVYKKK